VKQYPEWFWADQAWRARGEAIAARTEDAAHFGSKYLPGATPADSARDITYHAPCHALILTERGHPGGEAALRRGAGLSHYQEIEQCCSGMGGTFGFKRSNRTIMETNRDRMMAHMRGLKEDSVVYTDCPSCRLALQEEWPGAIDHPVNAIYAWLKSGPVSPQEKEE
jgi:Fe-S oxidoreductase